MIYMFFLVRKTPPPQQPSLPCFHLFLTGYKDPSQQLTRHKHSHNFCPEPPPLFALSPWVASFSRQPGEKQVPKAGGESSHGHSQSHNNRSCGNESCCRWLGAGRERNKAHQCASCPQLIPCPCFPVHQEWHHPDPPSITGQAPCYTPQAELRIPQHMGPQRLFCANGAAVTLIA